MAQHTSSLKQNHQIRLLTVCLFIQQAEQQVNTLISQRSFFFLSTISLLHSLKSLQFLLETSYFSLTNNVFLLLQ